MCITDDQMDGCPGIQGKAQDPDLPRGIISQASGQAHRSANYDECSYAKVGG